MFYVLIISLKIILRLVILRWLFMATNQPEEKLEYEDFVGLTVTSLKDFLELRGLKQSGKKVELVARAFGAYKLGAPKKFTQEQIFDSINNEYQQRLQTNDIKSDPNVGKMTFKHGHILIMERFLATFYE